MYDMYDFTLHSYNSFQHTCMFHHTCMQKAIIWVESKIIMPNNQTYYDIF